MAKYDTSTSYSLKTPESFEKERVRLTDQAKVLFRIEKKILKTFMRQRGITKGLVLDLGSGNGSYLDIFLKHFVNWRGLGIEKNISLLRLARKSYPNLRFKKGDLNDPEYLKREILKTKPTVIILRFVLQHLSRRTRSKINKVLYECLPEGALVLVIEPDDSEYLLSEKSPLISELITRSIYIQASRGGDRTIAARLESEFYRNGWSKFALEKYALSNTNIGMDNLIKIMLPIWRTYRFSSEKMVVDNKVDRARVWLSKVERKGAFELSFPISVFCLEK